MFDLLTTTLNEHGLIEKPTNFYNIDETDLQFNSKVDKGMAVKGTKDVHVLTAGEMGETVSVIACNNAECNFIPPFSFSKV
jgi:hypothetical protein